MRKSIETAFFLALICFLFCITQLKNENIQVFSQVVRDMGYEDVSNIPYEVENFTIPENFSEVYIRYNNLLKTAGYDLTPYKGKECKRYTYLIESINARANIIVCDGKIIGGDISGITLDGLMIPIDKKIDNKLKQ